MQVKAWCVCPICRTDYVKKVPLEYAESPHAVRDGRNYLLITCQPCNSRIADATVSMDEFLATL